jgi:hypothetical protein
MNFGIAILAAFVTLAAVSLATKPESEEALDEFYQRPSSPSLARPVVFRATE